MKLKCCYAIKHRINNFVGENLKFLLKEFQFVMSLKILRSMAYTVCHAPLPIMSCYRNNYDVILMSKWCHRDNTLPRY